MSDKEKNYKVMTNVAAGDIATGIVVIVTGIVCGVIAIVNGCRLLKNRSGILF